MRKAVYFFCTDYERDEVAPRVLNYLKNNYPLNLRDYKFDNKNIDSILFIHNDIILKVLRYDM